VNAGDDVKSHDFGVAGLDGGDVDVIDLVPQGLQHGGHVFQLQVAALQSHSGHGGEFISAECVVVGVGAGEPCAGPHRPLTRGHDALSGIVEDVGQMFDEMRDLLPIFVDELNDVIEMAAVGFEEGHDFFQMMAVLPDEIHGLDDVMAILVDEIHNVIDAVSVVADIFETVDKAFAVFPDHVGGGHDLFAIIPESIHQINDAFQVKIIHIVEQTFPHLQSSLEGEV